MNLIQAVGVVGAVVAAAFLLPFALTWLDEGLAAPGRKSGLPRAVQPLSDRTDPRGRPTSVEQMATVVSDPTATHAGEVPAHLLSPN